MAYYFLHIKRYNVGQICPSKRSLRSLVIKVIFIQSFFKQFEDPRGFAARYRGFAALLALSNCIKPPSYAGYSTELAVQAVYSDR